MTVYIILVILCVFFTWLQQLGYLKNGLKISYFLVFLFLALRYDFGNDYMSYYNEFLLLQSLQDDLFYFRGNEFAWRYLNYFFKFFFGDIGFHLMLASMAAFFTFVLYRFTTKYIPSKYHTFAIALILLEPNIILVLSSGMRQSVAVAIFLLSFDYLIQKKYLQYLAGIVLASLFHTSVLVFITLIVLNIVNWRIYMPYVLFIFFGLLILLNRLEFIFYQVNLLLESQESEYMSYLNRGFVEVDYGLGFALYVFLYLTLIVVNRKLYYDIKKNTIIKIVIVALFLLVFSLSVNLATRLSFYLFPMIVSGFSFFLINLGKSKYSGFRKITLLSMLIIVAFFAYQNYLFFKSKVYAPYFSEYKTIFQSPLLK